MGLAPIERAHSPVRGPNFRPRTVVKCGICYGKVCLSVTLVSHALTIQDNEICLAPKVYIFRVSICTAAPARIPVVKSWLRRWSQWVREWVSLSHKMSWTLYRSQSFTDLHQTCHQGWVKGDVVTRLLFLMEIRNISIRQTGNGINHHHIAPMELQW